MRQRSERMVLRTVMRMFKRVDRVLTLLKFNVEFDEIMFC